MWGKIILVAVGLVLIILYKLDKEVKVKYTDTISMVYLILGLVTGLVLRYIGEHM